MSLQSLLQDHSNGRPSAVAVGTFDGVHVGHQALLGKAVELARASAERSMQSVAITFVHPPRTVLKPQSNFLFLNSLEDRIRLIHELGVDIVIPVEFDDSVRAVSPEDFASMLTETLRMEHFISGPGSAVGKNRSGNPDAMKTIGEKLGYQVHSVSPVIYNEDSVSSSLIRTALAGGRTGEVAGMLGRRFTVTGTVQTGKKRGQEIGFPTANISIGSPEYPIAIPADGIYATWAILDDGTRKMAATSIGIRPTFDDGETRTVEAYLLDFDGDLYTRALSLEFVRRLRPEKKFPGVKALVKQMNQDVESTRTILEQDARAVEPN